MVRQVELFNANPIGKTNAAERLDALVAEGACRYVGMPRIASKSARKRFL
jgi:hypothetical protein